MKKLFFGILLFWQSSAYLPAQQRPHYTQYVINPFIINPAIAGIDNYTDLKMSVRDQWVGINGAPTTTYLSVHGPISKDDYRTSATSFRVPGENPRGKYYWENYTAAEPHHGVGLTLINDRTGSFNFFSAAATYAYHLGLNPTTNLSGGFSAGISYVTLDRSKQDFDGNGTGNDFDPALTSSTAQALKRIRPQMSAGLWLYSRDYFAGFSIQQVIPQTVDFSDNNVSILTRSKFIPHLFFTVGYRFLLNDDINAIPSFMIKYIKGSSLAEYQPEINLKLQYRDLLWLGGSYRYQDGYAGILGLNVGNTFNVSYSYDRTTRRNILSPYNDGTHEVVFGFIMGNKYSEACPRCY
ncbi:MAG: type IX secretion system membrane protein PorP/SprF [Chitinophagaceae bacterium]|nr:type IX secretion system membrane protein PorP/SprF [Chitinophagaceae bacterium]